MKKQRSPFVMVDQAVLRDQCLTPHQKTIYSVLCSYADWEDGTCFPSYQTLADKSGCSRRIVVSAIAKLKERGLIEKRERRSPAGDHTSNFYVVKFIAGAIAAPHSDAKRTPPGADVTPPDAADAPEQYPLNDTHLNEIHLSITEEDQLDRWRQRIGYEYFEEEMPDKLTYVDSLLGYIFELEQENKPELNRLLATVDDLAMLEFLEEIRDKSFGHVVNFRQYLKKVFIEFLREREITLAAI